MKRFQIGIDLGGTKTEAILFDSKGIELRRERIPTPRKPRGEYKAILETVTHLIGRMAKLIPSNNSYTVGIGIPGTIDPVTHCVQNANTTCLIGRPFKKDIEKRLGRIVGMENDANCFTLAESRSGAAVNHSFVMGIIMGTGCGGGICIDNRIHRGRHMIAGEWGHISIDPNGSPCFCGNRGCIETKISGTGVEKAFLKKYREPLKMNEIVLAYRKQEPRAIDIFEQFLDDFGRCMGGLISVLDPDAVVLGGGLSNIDELYTLGKKRTRRYAFHKKIKTPILKNRLGDSAGVFGAAWIGK